MMQQILNGTLAPRHRDAGLSLVDKDGDLQLLDFNMKLIKSFPGTGALILDIITAADNYLIDSNLKNHGH
ncbi:hypothetical protein MUP46_01120 [Patescibacteria group bacterium]|nr:hypothetical protein [Patescibacteria group bacterium]